MARRRTSSTGSSSVRVRALTAPLHTRRVVVGLAELARAQRCFEPTRREGGDGCGGDGVVDQDAADTHAVLAPAVDDRGARAVIAGRRVATAVVDAQSAPAAPARAAPLQEGSALSHGALWLVTARMGVGSDAHLVGLEDVPVDEAGMVVTDDDAPFRARQAPGPLAQSPGLVDVALVTRFPIDVGAR